jgi:hypothetical protein
MAMQNHDNLGSACNPIDFVLAVETVLVQKIMIG